MGCPRIIEDLVREIQSERSKDSSWWYAAELKLTFHLFLVITAMDFLHTKIFLVDLFETWLINNSFLLFHEL